MAEIVSFPNRTKVRATAADWLARLDRGLSPAETAELQRWLRAEASHREAFMALAEVWDKADVLAELAELLPLEPPSGGRKLHWRAWASAAGVLALIAGALLAYRAAVQEPAGNPSAPSFAAEYTTSVGEQAVRALLDGSVITLNTDTRIDVELSPDERNVYLHRGEAYFDVAHDAAKPFKVHAGNRLVQALGTAFNVRLDPDGSLEVVVRSGVVRVDRSDAMPGELGPQGGSSERRAGRERASVVGRTLTEGQVARLDGAGGSAATASSILRLEQADMDIKLAWQRGMLIFRGEPLEAMLEEIGRYTTVDFVIADRELADVRVGGYFRAGDVESLLMVLRNNFQIESEGLGTGRIVLRAAR